MFIFSFFTTLSRDGEDLEVEVSYKATARVPATFMQPPEGGEVELLAVLDGAGAEIKTTVAEDTLLLRECFDRMDEAFGDFDTTHDETDWWRDDVEDWL